MNILLFNLFLGGLFDDFIMNLIIFDEKLDWLNRIYIYFAIKRYIKNSFANSILNTS